MRSLPRCHLWRCFVLILVLCGTQKQSFTRMIKEVEKLSDDYEIEIIVQAGHNTYSSEKMKIFDFISQEELSEFYEKANYIITHAGAGSMFQAIKAEKKTIAFPRLQKYNEHVDDHQLQLAEKLKNLGYLLTFNDGDDIVEVFNEVKKFKPTPYELKGEIPTLIDKQLAKVFRN